MKRNFLLKSSKISRNQGLFLQDIIILFTTWKIRHFESRILEDSSKLTSGICIFLQEYTWKITKKNRIHCWAWQFLDSENKLRLLWVNYIPKLQGYKVSKQLNWGKIRPLKDLKSQKSQKKTLWFYHPICWQVVKTQFSQCFCSGQGNVKSGVLLSGAVNSDA